MPYLRVQLQTDNGHFHEYGLASDVNELLRLLAPALDALNKSDDDGHRDRIVISIS